MKPDFPSLADEIAEPRPDMNIKVATFTVSEKTNYIYSWFVKNMRIYTYCRASQDWQWHHVLFIIV